MELSQYCLDLDEVHQIQYKHKIAVIGADPYCVKIEDCSTDLDHFPNIMYPDIVNYLVYGKNAYSLLEMKNYKSLESYNQAACGWVKKVAVKKFGSNTLIVGKVSHSQRLNEKLTSPWIIATNSGDVTWAHCDCVAGLGESGTHVGAVLFNIDAYLRKQEEVSVTGKKAYWMPPSKKPGAPSKISELDLRTAKRKKLEGSNGDVPVLQRESAIIAANSIPPLNKEEIGTLLQELSETPRGCVLHLAVSPFCEVIHEEYTTLRSYGIMRHFKDDYLQLSLLDLQRLGSSLNLSLNNARRLKGTRSYKPNQKCGFCAELDELRHQNLKMFAEHP